MTWKINMQTGTPILVYEECSVIQDEQAYQALRAIAEEPALRSRVMDLEKAIVWALGAGGSFPERPKGKGLYWWRSELQKRAGLKWDGEKFVPEQICPEHPGLLGHSTNMVNKKTWEEFRATGLLWWINALLHTFGWALVVEVEDNGTISGTYPARVKFRGFGPADTEEGYRKVAGYLAKNADELNQEAQAE